jgi:hypothetical protein
MTHDPDFLELASISETNLDSALQAIHGYLKFASILWIRALGEPTLDGVVIRRWSRRTARALRRFCTRYRCNEFVLRIDKQGARWSARRGGYLIPAAAAHSIVRELSDEGMIAVMLEPVSPNRDLYCLSCVTIPEQGKIVVEVVGPGFDTSDLVRSDLLPHERFEFPTELAGHDIAAPADPALQRTYVISEAAYRRSVDDRLAKIGARLLNPAFPREVTVEAQELRERARRALRKNRETVLLRHATKYDPIPRQHLLRFTSGVVKILSGLERHSISLGTVTLSGTFTTRRRLVYWDFFPADTSKAHLLYSVGRPR